MNSTVKRFIDRRAQEIGRRKVKRDLRRRNLCRKGGTDGHGSKSSGEQQRGCLGLRGGVLAFTDVMEHMQNLKREKLLKRYRWDEKIRKTVKI